MRGQKFYGKEQHITSSLASLRVPLSQRLQVDTYYHWILAIKTQLLPDPRTLGTPSLSVQPSLIYPTYRHSLQIVQSIQQYCAKYPGRPACSTETAAGTVPLGRCYEGEISVLEAFDMILIN